jgi:hypothetical protein
VKVCAIMKIVTDDGKCHEKLDFGNYDMFYQTMKHGEIYEASSSSFWL